MRTELEVVATVQQLYRRTGGDPAPLLQILPVDGSWENALAYLVQRGDGRQALIRRRDLDDRNEQALMESLRALE